MLRKRIWPRTWVFLIAWIFFALPNLESFASDYQSPRTASLGGAGHAGPLSNDSIYLNPSYTSFMKSYSVAGSYSSYTGDPNHGRLLNASILDGRSPLFQAGLGYTVRNDGSWIHLGASKAFVQRLSTGIGGKLVLVDGKPEAKELTVSASGIIGQWIQASVTADNVLGDEKGKKLGLSREIVVGTKFMFRKILVAYIDPQISFSDEDDGNLFGWEAGLEFTAFKDLFIRSGMFRNATVPYVAQRGRGFGMGLGWVAQRITLDYAFQRTLEANETGESAISHVFGATVYF